MGGWSAAGALVAPVGAVMAWCYPRCSYKFPRRFTGSVSEVLEARRGGQAPDPCPHQLHRNPPKNSPRPSLPWSRHRPLQQLPDPFPNAASTLAAARAAAGRGCQRKRHLRRARRRQRRAPRGQILHQHPRPFPDAPFTLAAARASAGRSSQSHSHIRHSTKTATPPGQALAAASATRPRSFPKALLTPAAARASLLIDLSGCGSAGTLADLALSLVLCWWRPPVLRRLGAAADVLATLASAMMGQ